MLTPGGEFRQTGGREASDFRLQASGFRKGIAPVAGFMK
jgi:hypothetical protein